MVIEIERTRSLDTTFPPDQLYGAIYGGERNAHKFIITSTRDGAEITLSGTVTAKFLRADNVDVALTGTIEGGKACVTLGDECYAVPGRYKLAIFVTSGTETLCVYAAIGNSDRTAGSSTVDGGNIIPSVSDLIAQINAAVATIPASYTDLMAGVAGTYDASKTYAVGDYAWYNGVLYKCTTAITTAESWTAAHWSRAVLGDDVTGLKSAIDDIDGELHKRTKNLYDKSSANPIDKKFINSQGQLGDSDYNAFSGFMPCEPSTTYIFSIGGARVKVVSYWNDNAFLSRETIDDSSFTTPSNCNKIGFNLFATAHTTEEFEYAINHAQLEKGTVATDYVPYIINALDTVVKTEVQELTTDQKTQVRQNIGAASVSEVNEKLNAPSTAGTAGQVLTSDGQGGQIWQDATGGSVDVDETLTQSGKAADAKVVGDIVFTRTKNLYDKDSAGALDKKSISQYGDLQDSSNNAFSGFMLCEPSTTYIFSIGGANVKVVSFFNGTTFLGREAITNNGSFTTPANCDQIGFNLFATSHTTEEFEYAINHAQLEKGTVATDYVPYKIAISEKMNSLYTTYHGKNLYDKNTCEHEDKKSYNSSGIITSGNSYAITGLIPCEGNSIYTFRAGDAYVQYVIYFHDQTFISREMIKGASFTTPANCNAVGFNLFAAAHTTEQYEAAINAAQLEHGTQATSYETYNSEGTQSYGFITGGIGENAGKAISQKAMTEILAYPRRSSWWKGKSGDSLGDSLTYKFDNFQRFVKPYLDLANFYNNGITGTKLAGASNAYGDSMWMDSRINALHEDADFITIFGGANDPSTEDIGTVDVSNYDTNTFAGAFNVIISKIYYRYLALNEGHYPSIDYSGVQQLSEPHNVLLLPCTVFYVPGGIAKLEEKANAVRTLSNAWGLRVVDFRAESQANPFVADVYWTQSDNIHPTAKFYQERLAPLLINALEHLPPVEYPTEPATL